MQVEIQMKFVLDGDVKIEENITIENGSAKVLKPIVEQTCKVLHDELKTIVDEEMIV